jgi:hypothetical protein
MLVEYRELEAFYNRDELYDDNGQGALTRRVVKEQIALLIDGYRPKHSTGDSDDLDAAEKIMIDEVLCAEPIAVVLESACRYIRRNNKFMPRIPEVLDAIKKQRALWEDRRCVCDQDQTVDEVIDYYRSELQRAITDAKNVDEQAGST